MQRVYRAESANVHSPSNNLPVIGITVVGIASTSGWKKPRLGPWFYFTPPKDGIQDFDFLAQEPEGIVLPVLLPISATVVIPRDRENYWGEGQPLRGVRIHSQTNSIEVLTESGEAMDFFLASNSLMGGDATPWPWANLLGGDDPFPLSTGNGKAGAAFGFSELTGKSLRVYQTGDMLTKDYRQDRANIELDPVRKRIVQTWIG